MRPEDLRRLLQQRPFRPFRFYVLETIAYEVRHPEMAMVGASTVTIDTPGATYPIPVAKHSVILALLHITRLEPILPTPSPLADGG